MSYRPLTDLWFLARPAKPRGFGPCDKTLDLDPDVAPDFLSTALDRLPNRHGWGDPREHTWAGLIADPPYTFADADHYAPGRAAFPSANLILKNMLDVVRDGGRVGMLNYVLPQPPKVGVKFVACVGVIVGFNNRMRCYSVFERTT